MIKSIPFDKKPESPAEFSDFNFWSKQRKFLFEIYQNETLLCYLSADDEMQLLELIKLFGFKATKFRVDHWGLGPWHVISERE